MILAGGILFSRVGDDIVFGGPQKGSISNSQDSSVQFNSKKVAQDVDGEFLSRFVEIEGTSGLTNVDHQIICPESIEEVDRPFKTGNVQRGVFLLGNFPPNELRIGYELESGGFGQIQIGLVTRKMLSKLLTSNRLFLS